MNEIILQTLKKMRTDYGGNEMIIFAQDSDLQVVANEIEKAISVTRSCTQLLCVDTWCYKNLTKDKKYTLIKQDAEQYTIIDDHNDIWQVDKVLFEEIKQ